MLVGEGEAEHEKYKQELRQIVEKLGLAQDVIFTGFRRDIPELLAAFDVLVLPSLEEAFGRVVIEAMACAKPVVATRGGGLPEIIRDKETGLLVPVKDPQAIAGAVLQLLADKALARQMGLSGRKRAEEMFDILTHVQLVFFRLPQT